MSDAAALPKRPVTHIVIVTVVTAALISAALLAMDRAPFSASARILLDIWGSQHVPSTNGSLADGSKATVSVPFDVQMQTVEELGRSGKLMERLGQRLASPARPPQDAVVDGEHVRVDQVQGSALVEVTAESRSARRAVILANAAAHELSTWYTELQLDGLRAAEQAMLQRTGELQEQLKATPIGEPSSPVQRAYGTALEYALMDLTTIRASRERLTHRPSVSLVQRASDPALPGPTVLLIRGVLAVVFSIITGIFIAHIIERRWRSQQAAHAEPRERFPGAHGDAPDAASAFHGRL